jgi:hypothetical protein
MHPVTASYIAKSFEADRLREAEKDRRAAALREALRPDAGRVGTSRRGVGWFAFLLRRAAAAQP